MPRFYFNVYDGTNNLDAEGTEFASWEEARVDAIRMTSEILNDNRKRIASNADWYMEVTDETGLVLFRLDFQIMTSAALAGSVQSGPDYLRA